jgi:hypothetical protein
MFSKCVDDECKFNLTQWKSWLFYLAIFIGLLILILFIVSLAKPRVVVDVQTNGAPKLYPGYVAMK